MTMKVVLASEPERDDLFAEIHFADQPWAEIALDSHTRRFILTLYASDSGVPHVFSLQDAEDAIAEARRALEVRGFVER